MNPKLLASFTVLTLLLGVYSGVAFADDKSDAKAKQAQSKPSSDQKSCANDLDLIKKLLDNASEKVVALKQKLYSEWQSASSSGQTKDDWSVYAKKLELSQEMQDYMNLQEKYNIISSSCTAPATQSESKVTFTQSDECVNAQKMVDSIDKKYSVLKQNAYDTWKSQNAAGTYPGTWDQFANEFINSSPVTELNQARQKYEPVLRTCYTQTNVITPIPATQSQSCPDSDIQSVQSMLSDASQRIGALREKVYSEWKSSYDSGKIKDGWDSYSKKNLEGSQEFANFQQLKQKLDSLYKMCKAPAAKPQTPEPAKSVNPEPGVQFTKSDECTSAKSALDSIDQKYSILKQSAYDTWKSQNAAGTYPGTWDQYADEKLIKSPDVLELAKMREKYEPVLRTCYVQSGGKAAPDSSQAKPMPAPENTTLTESKTKPLSPAKTVLPTTAPKTKPLPTVPAKTDQKQPAKTVDAKKQDMLSKLTKAKPKTAKKPAGLIQK